MEVCCLQFRVDPNDPGRNIARARSMLARSAQESVPDIYLLPELWTIPFDPGRESGPYSCSGSEEALAMVREFCRGMGVFAIAGSMPWQTDRGVVLRSWLVDDSGEPQGFYDKAHLLAKSGESTAFTAGDTPFFFDLGGFSCSVVTCYDIRFPEYTRSLAICGAEVVFVDAAWPMAYGEAWRTIVKALAMHNQLYVVACNACGGEGDMASCGDSLIVSPWGDVLACAQQGESAIRAELSTGEIHKCRGVFPFLKDRRSELYEMI